MIGYGRLVPKTLRFIIAGTATSISCRLGSQTPADESTSNVFGSNCSMQLLWGVILSDRATLPVDKCVISNPLSTGAGLRTGLT